MTFSGRPESAGASIAPVPYRDVLDPHEHSVQFYDDERFLLDELSRFIGSALVAGDAGVVIATEPHRHALVERLRAQGLDVAAAERRGRYLALDAAETLARCLRAGTPDACGCAEVLGEIIDRAAAAATGERPRVALFGEMVALLCADGDAEGTLALERIWNAVAAEHAVDVLCAYPMDCFSRADDAGRFGEVCAAHTRVVPGESYSTLVDDRQRLRTIALLQQKARALESEVEERRRVQDELRERNRELRAAVAARDVFLSVAAHELKTPITTLRAFAQLLLREQRRGREIAPERLETALRTIESQTGKLSGLMARLLDSAQIESGKLRLEPIRTDLVELVRSALGRQAVNGGHPVIFHGPDAFEALVDPVRFEQVISNLVDNAVKFSPDGGTVTVELGCEADGRVRLSVTDEGVGIPPEKREDVFDRFHQADDERHLSGMGLGLYVSREIVELHGGCLRIEDPPHPGSRLVVSLPPTFPERQAPSVQRA